MSKYTTELRFIVEQLAGKIESVPYSGINDVISAARPKIFSFNYELYDNSKKEELETLFIRHFYFREIGLETYGLWQAKLEEHFQLEIPYYNQFWLAAQIDFDPLINYEVRESRQESAREDNTDGITRQSTARTDITSGNTQKFLDTPQGGLSGIISDNYLTNSTINNSDSNSVYTDSSSDTHNETRAKQNNVSRLTTGLQGSSKQELLEKYYQTMKNVNKMFLDGCEPLFMQIW